MATNTTTPAATPASAPKYPDQVTGMYILAKALQNVGIDTIYGLVGIPVTELAYLAQDLGIRFISFNGTNSRPVWRRPPTAI